MTTRSRYRISLEISGLKFVRFIRATDNADALNQANAIESVLRQKGLSAGEIILHSVSQVDDYGGEY